MHTAEINLRTGNPLWQAQDFPKIKTEDLAADERADVVVIGAGITGAMAAEELAGRGYSVIMLDKRGPMKGATSATTALLQYDIDVPLSKLIRKLGKEKAFRAYRRSKLALDSLAEKIMDLDLSCDLEKQQSLYLAGTELNSDGLRRESLQRLSAGLYCRYLSRSQVFEEFGIARQAALVTPDSYSVNPMKMTGGFLEQAKKNGCRIFAPVEVTEINLKSERTVLLTDGPYTVEAKYVIYATGYEMPSFANKRKNKVRSTYAIATTRQKKTLWPDPVLIWEASDPYLYLRATADGRIICGGGDEDFESEEMRDALLVKKTYQLENKLSKLLPGVESAAEFAWCGSFGTNATGLPTICPIAGLENCYMILAFGGNGITFSRLAAEVIAARICGYLDPDEGLFAC